MPTIQQLVDEARKADEKAEIPGIIGKIMDATLQAKKVMEGAVPIPIAPPPIPGGGMPMAPPPPPPMLQQQAIGQGETGLDIMNQMQQAMAAVNQYQFEQKQLGIRRGPGTLPQLAGPQTLEEEKFLAATSPEEFQQFMQTPTLGEGMQAVMEALDYPRRQLKEHVWDPTMGIPGLADLLEKAGVEPKIAGPLAGVGAGGFGVALGVLSDEEKALAYSYVFDPLLAAFFPAKTLQAAKVAVRGSARMAELVVQATKSPAFQKRVAAAREAVVGRSGELGAAKVPGEPPKPPEPPPTERAPFVIDAPPTEEFGYSARRQHAGALEAFALRAKDDVAEVGMRAHQARLPDMRYRAQDGTWWFKDEPHQAGLDVIKALRNEGPIPAGYEDVFAGARKLYQTEEREMLALFPDVQAKFIQEPYSHIQYKLVPGPKRAGVRAPRPGELPEFLQRRSGKTIEENLAWRGPHGERLELVTYDPMKFVLLRRLAGEEYRQGRIVVERWKEAASPEVAGLRRATPKADAPGDWVETSIRGFNELGLVVSPDDAKFLKDFFPVSYGATTRTGKIVESIVQSTRLAKVFLSPQQYYDLTTRALSHATGYGRLQDIPASIRGLFSWISPKARRAFDRQLATNPDFQLGITQGLNVRSGQEISRRGVLNQLKGEDVLGLPFIKDIPIPERLSYIKAVRDRLNGAAAFLQSGLYDYVYSHHVAEAYLRMLRQQRRIHPEWTEAARAAEAAKAANTMFSALPDWQSVFRNPETRRMFRNLIFGPVENEALPRAAGGMFKGGYKAAYIRYFAGIMLFNLSVAQVMNRMFTGEWLDPRDQLKPIKEGGPLGLQMNSHFLRPRLPGAGPHGENRYLDLLGQQDTVARWLDPLEAIKNRLAVPWHTGWQAGKKETYWGRPLNPPGWRNKLHAWLEYGMEVAAPMGAAALLPGSGERPSIGWEGAFIQAAGMNVSSEGLGQMKTRRALELAQTPGYTGPPPEEWENEQYKDAPRQLQEMVDRDPDIMAKENLWRERSQARIAAGIADMDEAMWEGLNVAADTYSAIIEVAGPMFLENAPQARDSLRAGMDSLVAVRLNAEDTYPKLSEWRDDFSPEELLKKPIEQWTPQEVSQYTYSLYDLYTDPKTNQILPERKDELWEELDRLESRLTPEQFKQYQRDLGAKDTELMALRRSQFAELNVKAFTIPDIEGELSYNEIPDAVWEAVVTKNDLWGDIEEATGITRPTFSQFKTQVITDNKDTGLPVGDILQRNDLTKAVQAQITKWRQKAEESRLDLLATLITWGTRTNARDELLEEVIPLVDKNKQEIASLLDGGG